jgi:nicotinamidase-related amidase
MLRLSVILFTLSGCLATSGVPIGPYEQPTTALILLDLQRDLLEADGRMPVAQAQVPPLLDTATALHAAARAKGLPVIRVENLYTSSDVGNLFRNGATVRGTPGAAWDPRAPVDADAMFEKDAPDALSNPAFDAALREKQVTHLVISGVFADGCVTWTTRGALNRGYRVTLVRSGVAAGSEQARSDALERLKAEGVAVPEAVDGMDWAAVAQ